MAHTLTELLSMVVDLITYDMLAHQIVTVATREEWFNWNAERLVEALRKVYPMETTTRSDTRWVGSPINLIEALHLNVFEKKIPRHVG